MKCSKCGNTQGYYKRVFISGWGSEYYNSDNGICEENGQIHDYLKYKHYKSKYCSSCRKRLTDRELYGKIE